MEGGNARPAVSLLLPAPGQLGDTLGKLRDSPSYSAPKRGQNPLAVLPDRPFAKFFWWSGFSPLGRRR